MTLRLDPGEAPEDRLRWEEGGCGNPSTCQTAPTRRPALPELLTCLRDRLKSHDTSLSYPRGRDCEIGEPDVGAEEGKTARHLLSSLPSGLRILRENVLCQSSSPVGMIKNVSRHCPVSLGVKVAPRQEPDVFTGNLRLTWPHSY
ncbi:uncharacterized protein LOC123775981 isoform X3 [Ursus americanus]|uniref:uncharacterized protein LOC123775981 isoform X3 n=1 Tax=Ursus americanus TaxID=9643 RepID=UPI001E679A79|nr:uncharacterized protein LOC123775981 isoform X3 [Ursus americanus]